jgi:WD40 repeat protein
MKAEISTTAASVHTNPFPGLRPFREDEEYLFFGRETQVDAMVDKLALTRFLAVVGTSGSGKSSLVNCGLRPALHGGLMACAGTAWRMAQFRPGSHPIRAMAHALAKDGVLFRDYQAAGLPLTEIIDTTLHMSKLGLIDIYEQANLGEDINLLVVVDQFEELFRYQQLGGSQEHVNRVTATAAAFVNLLLEARAQSTHPIYIVLTMRSDFLGDCSQFPGLAEAINAGQYLVPRLNRDERRQAISGPVAVGGAEISPVLLMRLVNDVGDNTDQLSILQHALNRTWARWRNGGVGKGALDLTHYEAIGTMARALDQHAEKAYAELTTTRQHDICEKLFKGLTDKATDARGVRRPTTLGTLCALADGTAADVTAVIEVFRKPSRSFLMPPAGEALETDTVIDISHESLMRVWQRLMTWSDEEAQSAQMYRRLADAATRYAVGRSSLWRDPDLQLALDWRDQNQPNETWASRYAAGFDAACAFLRDSEAAHVAELKKEQERLQAETERKAQERELEQTRALAEAQRRRADDQAAASVRQRRLVWGLLAIALVALCAAGFGLYQERMAEDQRQVAQQQRTIAEDKTRIAMGALATAEHQKEAAKQQAERAEQQAILAEENRQKSEKSTALATLQTKRAEVQAGLLRQQGKDLELAVLLARLESIPDASVDARLQLAAEAARRRLEPETQNGLFKRLFLTAAPRDVAWPSDLSAGILSMAISRDDQRLFAVAKDRLRVVDLASGQERASMPLSEYPGFDGDSKRPLLLTSGEKLLMLWNKTASVVDGNTLRVMGSPISNVTAFTASADGTRAAFLVGSQSVTLCDLTTDCKSISEHDDVKDLSPEDLELSEDGKSLVIIQQASSDARQIALFDAVSWKRRKVRAFRDITKLAIGVDKDHVHVCTPDALRRYDAFDASLDETIVRRFAPASAEKCRLFGERTVSSHADGVVRVWDSTGMLVTQASARVKGAFQMALGDTMLVAAESGSVHAWDVRSYGRRNARLEARQLMAVSESLELAAYMAPDSTQHNALTLATLGTPEPEQRWTWPIDADSRVTGVAISPDERFVIVTKEVGVATRRPGPGQTSMVILDARSRAPNIIKDFPGKSFVVFASASEVLAFNESKADESKLVIVSLKNWAESRVDPSQLRPDAALSAAFSRDGRRLALAIRGENGTSRVVEVFEWPGMNRVTGQLTHLADVTNLSFNAAGDSLLTSTSDGTTHVWDVATTKETLRIPPPGRQSTRAVFTRSGEVAILDDSGLTVLPSDANGLVNEACGRVSRNLTPQEWALYVGRGIAYQKTCPSRPGGGDSPPE